MELTQCPILKGASSSKQLQLHLWNCGSCWRSPWGNLQAPQWCFSSLHRLFCNVGFEDPTEFRIWWSRAQPVLPPPSLLPSLSHTLLSIPLTPCLIIPPASNAGVLEGSLSGTKSQCLGGVALEGPLWVSPLWVLQTQTYLMALVLPMQNCSE